MKLTIIALLLGVYLPLSVNADVLTFGAPVNTVIKVNISTLLKTPEHYLNKQVTIGGMIIGVCKKRGCWMELASDARYEKLRIKVKDGDMVFPVSAKGRQALATGKFTEIKLDLAHTRQYKQQLSKRMGKPFDPASIKEGMSIYQVVPVGVKILD